LTVNRSEHNPTTATLPTPEILVVVSAADRIPLHEGGFHPTGTYLGELTEPTAAMLAAGFTLAFATPGGRPPTIDPASYNLALWSLSGRRLEAAKRTYQRLLDLGLAHPMQLEEIAYDLGRLVRFEGMFVPGGHAPMVDLLHQDAVSSDALNKDFGALLAHFHRTGRTTGLICHAPAALAAAPRIDGRWLYKGYRMTCIRTVADRLLEALPGYGGVDGHFREYAAEVLAAAGAKLEHTCLPAGSKVVEDRELITGQDPFSARAFGKTFVDKVRRSKAAA
jgi:putative intracellular protease/amidase